MKLLTYLDGGREQLGLLRGGSVVPLESLGLHFADMNELILHAAKEQLDALAKAELASGGASVQLSDVTVLAPIPCPRQDVLCLGLNYAAHAEESARYHKRDFSRDDQDPPVYFSKRVNRAVGPDAPIDSHQELVQRLDYEVELAVILGKDAYRVKAQDAAEYIFGYTVFNDVSARDIQHRHKQWYRGKSLEGFTAMGPWIVTADEIAFPPRLSIQSRVNGELRQDSNTSMQIFDIPYVLEELTAGMRLLAGTIIATGTPAGVGMGFDPPKFLKPGDTVDCYIENIGTLHNVIE